MGWPGAEGAEVFRWDPLVARPAWTAAVVREDLPKGVEVALVPVANPQGHPELIFMAQGKEYEDGLFPAGPQHRIRMKYWVEQAENNWFVLILQLKEPGRTKAPNNYNFRVVQSPAKTWTELVIPLDKFEAPKLPESEKQPKDGLVASRVIFDFQGRDLGFKLAEWVVELPDSEAPAAP